jgi:tripartite-type tricarboxylate transporter receptor subunit TctC
MKPWSLLLAVAAAAPAHAASPSAGGDYPSKPIRMLVGYAPGGGPDWAARIVGQKLTQHFGQTVVVDNRSGANGIIACEMTARAVPDGYTLMMLAIGQSIASAHGTKLPYDLLTDLVPVSQVIQQPYLIVATTSLPAKTVSELVTLAKSKPGQLSYGSTGVAGSNHLAAEIFSGMAGVRMVHVPYKGSAPALADVVAGQVNLMFSSIVTGLPLSRSGRLRPIAVTTLKRSAAAPDIPTVAESYPGFEAISWYGVVAPKGTPAAVIDRLQAGIAKGMLAPDVQSRASAEGSEAISTSPAEFGKFLSNELARFSKVIREAGIKAE